MPAQTEAVDLDNANEPGAEPAAAQQQRPRRREEELSPYARRLRLYGLLFVAPWIIGFVLFTLWPALTSLYYSFTDYNPVKARHNFIGLANWRRLFTDPEIGQALGTSMRFLI